MVIKIFLVVYYPSKSYNNIQSSAVALFSIAIDDCAANVVKHLCACAKDKSNYDLIIKPKLNGKSYANKQTINHIYIYIINTLIHTLNYLGVN